MEYVVYVYILKEIYYYIEFFLVKKYTLFTYFIKFIICCFRCITITNLYCLIIAFFMPFSYKIEFGTFFTYFFSYFFSIMIKTSIFSEYFNYISSPYITSEL